MSERQTDIRFPFGMSHEQPRTDFEIPAMQKPGIIFSVSAKVDKIIYNEKTRPVLRYGLDLETLHNDGSIDVDNLHTIPIEDAGTLKFVDDEVQSIDVDEQMILSAALDTWEHHTEKSISSAEEEIDAKSVTRKLLIAAGISGVVLGTMLSRSEVEKPLQGVELGVGMSSMMLTMIFAVGAIVNYQPIPRYRKSRIEHAAKADRLLSFIDIVERFGLSYKNKKIDTAQTTIQDAKTE